MTDIGVHSAEPFPDALVPIAPRHANAGASHLPRENASVEAQVVGADSVAFLQQRQDIVQELAQHLVQRPAMLKVLD